MRRLNQAVNTGMRHWGALLERVSRSLPITFAISTLFFLFVRSVRGDRPVPESVFHIAVANTYATKGWPTEFPWMHSTWLAQDFVDPYWLTHWLIVPSLIVVPDALQVLGWLEPIIAALSLTCLSFVLGRLGVRLSVIWALFAVVATPLALVRISAFRGTSLFSIVWLLFIYASLKSKTKVTFTLSWLAVYLYTGFLLLPITAGVLAIAEGIVERRVVWKPVVASLVGMCGGLIVTPYSPHHFRFYREDIVDSLVQEGLVPGVTLSAEWSSLSSFELVRFAVFPLAVLAFVGFRCAIYGKKLPSEAVGLWLLSTLLLLLSTRAYKFMDYAVPAVWLATASSWRWVRPQTISSRVAVSLGIGFVAILNLRSAMQTFDVVRQRQPKVSDYAELAFHLRQNAVEASCVVIPWDDFPFLFLGNPDNTYPVGLNPNYLKRTDNTRFLAYGYLYAGLLKEPDKVMAEYFDSKSLVVRKQPRTDGENRLVAFLRQYPPMRKIYENESFLMFQTIEQNSAKPMRQTQN